jgi:uncharacterized delta-60 repeat protein
MRSITNTLKALGEPLYWNTLQSCVYLPALMLCLTGISLTVSAAPSDLDPTFGIGGKVISNPNGSGSIPGKGMALQSDGKIVLVGGWDDSAPSFVVARYNVDGSLDTTFNSTGWVSVSFGGSLQIATSVAIQPDGKIVVAGFANVPNQDAAIARLNQNGSLDTTFDGDGKVTVNFVDFQGSYPDYIHAVKIANDGKIVFAGGALGSGLSYKAIIGRLNPNGSLDTTFDFDGTIVGGGGTWKDLIIQSDGAIVLVGGGSSQFSSGMGAGKYNNLGVGVWGYNRTVTPGCYIGLNGIAEQPDGKLVVVGSFGCKVIAIRLNTNGTEDNTFNNITFTPDGEAFSVAIQPDGKIVANFGYSNQFSGGFSVIRYNTNGSLDLGFGTGGTVITSVGNPASLDGGRKVLVQPDQKILVGGSARTEGYRFAMVRYLGGPSGPARTLFDYDGDGKADVSVYRPSTNYWYLSRSSDSQTSFHYFGAPNDILTPADFDGDGKTDLAIFRPSNGMWWYQSSMSGTWISRQWGNNGDIPLPSDFDADGRADYIVYHPANNYWYRASSRNGEESERYFGAAGDKPLTGDFDGDGRSDPAIFRPSTGVFWYMSSIDSVHRAIPWGSSTDIPAPADYDGDGKTDAAVYRPSNGVWYIFNSATSTYTFMPFGISEDKPVAADYDGDGKADIAVYRPSNGTWYLLQSTVGFAAQQWGAATDIPTENAFVP